MNTATLETTVPVPSIFDHFPRVATLPRFDARRRSIAFLAGLVAVPAATGIAAAIAGKRTSILRGLAAGGAAALALGAARLQMLRWFTPEPDYEVEASIGELEIRRYPTRIEARTELDARDFEHALDAGFGRLACYIYGANSERRDIPMATPVITTMRDGRYETSFVMPPDHPLSDLPKPDDVRVELREVPEKRVGVVRFRGRFTRSNVEAHERDLLRLLVDAGLSAKGSALFAGYDSPATLPFLRRNELWIEIV